MALHYACIAKDTLKVKHHLRGVVSTSPLIRLTHPEAGWKLTAGHMLSKVLPWTSIPAPVNAKAREFRIKYPNIWFLKAMLVATVP